MTTDKASEVTAAAEEAVRLLSTEISRFATGKKTAEQASADLNGVRVAVEKVVSAIGDLSAVTKTAVDDFRASVHTTASESRSSAEGIMARLSSGVDSNMESVERRSREVLASLEKLQVSSLMTELGAAENRLREALRQVDSALSQSNQQLRQSLIAGLSEIKPSIDRLSLDIEAAKAAMISSIEGARKAASQDLTTQVEVITKAINETSKRAMKRNTVLAGILAVMLLATFVMAFLVWLK